MIDWNYIYFYCNPFEKKSDGGRKHVYYEGKTYRWNVVVWNYWNPNDIVDSKKYAIHHIDGDRLNDSIYNLIKISHSEHSVLHRRGKVTSEETKQKLSEIGLTWDIYKAKKMRDEGYTWAEISRKMGVSSSCIRSAFITKGWIKKKDSKYRPLTWDIDKAKELWDKGERRFYIIAREVSTLASNIRYAFLGRGWHVPVKAKKTNMWDKDKAIELKMKGKSWIEIGKILDMNPGHIAFILARDGKYKPDKIKWNPEEAWKLIIDGNTLRKVSEIIGIDESYLSMKLKKMGYPVGKIIKGRIDERLKWDINKAKELWDEGFGWTDISRKIGEHPNSIRSAFISRGWFIPNKEK